MCAVRCAAHRHRRVRVSCAGGAGALADHAQPLRGSRVPALVWGAQFPGGPALVSGAGAGRWWRQPARQDTGHPAGVHLSEPARLSRHRGLARLGVHPVSRAHGGVRRGCGVGLVRVLFRPGLWRAAVAAGVCASFHLEGARRADRIDDGRAGPQAVARRVIAIRIRINRSARPTALGPRADHLRGRCDCDRFPWPDTAPDRPGQAACATAADPVDKSPARC